MASGKISGYAPVVFDPSPWAAFLSISCSFSRLSASKQYTMFPRQVVIVTAHQRVIKVDLNITYKGRTWRQRGEATLSTSSSCFFVALKPETSLFLSASVSFPPSVRNASFSLLYASTDRWSVLVSSNLPVFLTSRQKAIPCQPPRLAADQRKDNFGTCNAAVLMYKECLLFNF